MGLIAISSLMLLGGMYLMIAFAWWGGRMEKYYSNIWRLYFL
jgi:hypothetical protein